MLENSETKPIIVDFGAEWCGPCKKLEKYIDQVEKEFGESIEIVKFDISKETKVSEYLKVSSIPYVVPYVKGRQLTDLGFNGTSYGLTKLRTMATKVTSMY